MVQLAQLSDQDFDQVRHLIHDRVGIRLGDSKRAMVVSRLSRRMRELELDSFPDYLSRLDDPAANEWQFFTNALTTNLTSFFREAHHFDTLADSLRAARGRGLFRIWCAASSTGEEPYSIAMVVDEVGRDGPPDVEILASDIDTNVLERAAAGVYRLDSVKGLSPARLRRFFLRGTGPREGWARIRPELQRRVRFAQINLKAAPWPVDGPIDVIFCRNVMIYFDKPTQRTLIERFAKLMHEDSLFITGHSESLYHCDDLLKGQGRTVYRRAPE